MSCDSVGDPLGSVPVAMVLDVVLGLIRFPLPTVCRHLAALDILSALEDAGVQIPKSLVQAISRSSLGDAAAERILVSIIKDAKRKDKDHAGSQAKDIEPREVGQDVVPYPAHAGTE